jgi:hypothetical protein
MDRKAGYKECPRCGLRNKPSALQCDFCGLRFIAGEDWDDNITALEKMGGNEEKVHVDEDVSKRIEATIVKRDKINVQPKAKEPGKDDFDYFKKEPEPVRAAATPAAGPSIAMARGTVIEAAPEQRPVIAEPEPVRAAAPMPTPAPEQAPPQRAEPAPAPVPPAPERIVMPEQRPVEAAPQEPAQPVRDKKVIRRVKRPIKPVFSPISKKSTRRTLFTAVLMLGVVWYLVALFFGDSTVGRTGGWVLITLSTLMVVAGAGELFIPREGPKMTFAEEPTPEPKVHQEVLICPQCHELVSATDKVCPDCGAEFRSE